jgi:hypothetical protein
MNQVKIEIQTYSKEILSDLFDKDVQQLSSGNKQQIEDTDSEIEIIDYTPTESFGLLEGFTILLSIGSTVAINLISAWLFERLKKKKDVISITINGKSISSKKLTEKRLIAVLKAMNQNS